MAQTFHADAELEAGNITIRLSNSISPELLESGEIGLAGAYRLTPTE